MRGRLIRLGLPLLLIGVAGVGAAMAATARTHASATVKTAKNAKFGIILVASNGRTLYRYTLDSKGVNRCTSNAVCNKYWPPLLVKAGVKPTAGGSTASALLGTMKASHGMLQVTYAGFPLYRFAGDTGAGQVKGQGFQSQWYVVNTKGALVKHAAASPAPAPGYGTTTAGGGGGGGGWG
jgi:predicted lipoprotein with Yx(FWY)xxD motif